MTMAKFKSTFVVGLTLLVVFSVLSNLYVTPVYSSALVRSRAVRISSTPVLFPCSCYRQVSCARVGTMVSWWRSFRSSLLRSFAASHIETSLVCSLACIIPTCECNGKECCEKLELHSTRGRFPPSSVCHALAYRACTCVSCRCG
jgi:hypothetical protein